MMTEFKIQQQVRVVSVLTLQKRASYDTTKNRFLYPNYCDSVNSATGYIQGGFDVKEDAYLCGRTYTITDANLDEYGRLIVHEKGREQAYIHPWMCIETKRIQ